MIMAGLDAFFTAYLKSKRNLLSASFVEEKVSEILKLIVPLPLPPPQQATAADSTLPSLALIETGEQVVGIMALIDAVIRKQKVLSRELKSDFLLQFLQSLPAVFMSNLVSHRIKPSCDDDASSVVRLEEKYNKLVAKWVEKGLIKKSDGHNDVFSCRVREEDRNGKEKDIKVPKQRRTRLNHITAEEALLSMEVAKRELRDKRLLEKGSKETKFVEPSLKKRRSGGDRLGLLPLDIVASCLLPLLDPLRDLPSLLATSRYWCWLVGRCSGSINYSSLDLSRRGKRRLPILRNVIANMGSKWQNVKSLNLSGTDDVDMVYRVLESVIANTTEAPSLEVLDLSSTTVTAENMFTLLIQLPSLKRLYVQDCQFLSYSFLHLLLTQRPPTALSLEYLSFRCSHQVLATIEAGLASLATNFSAGGCSTALCPLPSLKCMDLSCTCPQPDNMARTFREATLTKSLLDNLYNLKGVGLVGWKVVTQKGITLQLGSNFNDIVFLEEYPDHVIVLGDIYLAASRGDEKLLQQCLYRMRDTTNYLDSSVKDLLLLPPPIQGDSALHLACKAASLASVELLLNDSMSKRFLSPTALNHKGISPVVMAFNGGVFEIVRVLKRFVNDPNTLKLLSITYSIEKRIFRPVDLDYLLEQMYRTFEWKRMTSRNRTDLRRHFFDAKLVLNDEVDLFSQTLLTKMTHVYFEDMKFIREYIVSSDEDCKRSDLLRKTVAEPTWWEFCRSNLKSQYENNILGAISSSDIHLDRI